LTYGRRLRRSFFARPSTVVAPDLLGRVLVRELPDGRRLAARLVEVEAYDEGDPASHSFRGPTPRTEVMFGPPGHLYVYLSYGLHDCMNVVTGPVGRGSAVLLRAAEPLEGLDAMSAHRGLDAVRLLCSGPGRLAQALAISRSNNGLDLVTGRSLHLHAGEPVGRRGIARTTRVGITVAADVPWRFVERESPFVSAGRPSVARPGAPTGSRRR
jgi:DNA-3-methyladenine glycosylase